MEGNLNLKSFVDSGPAQSQAGDPSGMRKGWEMRKGEMAMESGSPHLSLSYYPPLLR
jgi:hypothetical protein